MEWNVPSGDIIPDLARLQSMYSIKITACSNHNALHAQHTTEVGCMHDRIAPGIVTCDM